MKFKCHGCGRQGAKRQASAGGKSWEILPVGWAQVQVTWPSSRVDNFVLCGSCAHAHLAEVSG